ncbi:MAG: hypothetical protein LBT47_00200 [Deltaproteobacteria bacterium]|nr:hypothetical protein [Deltaproteobacteria bacterium]
MSAPGLWLWAYRTLGYLALGPALFWPTLKGRFGGSWSDRLGFTLCGGQKPLWVHAASVGEAASGLAVLAALTGQGYAGPKLLTVGTPAGLNYAGARLWPGQKIYDFQFPNSACPAGLPTEYGDVQLAAPPLDFWGSPARFLDRVEPRALVIVETEIWPELVYQCSQRSIPLIIVSGRMSERSFNRYQKISSFIEGLLKSFDLICAISQTDGDRFKTLGASPDRTLVIGSPKFDALIKTAQTFLSTLSGPNELLTDGSVQHLTELNSETILDASAPELPAQPQLIVCGSTHEGEEELILKAIKNLGPQNIRLVLAPRHLIRTAEVLSIATAAGFKAKLYSETKVLAEPFEVETAVVLDQVGVLADLYAQADLAVVGGSLLQGAGHNPMEPAACGRPIVFGPFMSSFKTEAESLVAVGAAVQTTSEGLESVLKAFLDDPPLARRAGLLAAKHMAALTPVAPKLAQLVLETIQGSAEKRQNSGRLYSQAGPKDDSSRPESLPGGNYDPSDPLGLSS